MKDGVFYVMPSYGNALIRYKAQKGCQGRDARDAEIAIREIGQKFRQHRESQPDLARGLLRYMLSKHFAIADTTMVMNCAEIVDNQYRAVKRLLRYVDLPDFRKWLEDAMKAASDSQ